ncbi:MAG: hypothetical protein Q8O92_10590 [Candidatus Latescibacter sp.]|nr:hypothetical protein [Candidatus Latescibacter sp.]
MLPNNNSVKLRAYAFHDKKNGKYYAVCIDLDLVDEGSSFEEVIGKMKENIVLYVGTELAYYKSKGITGFPYRKSSLDVILRYHFLATAYHVSFIVNMIKDRYRKYTGLFDLNTQVIHFNPA